MSVRVIEGTWEEIKRHEGRLVGRRLRVTIEPEKSARHEPGATPTVTSASAIQKRLDALNAWLMLPRPTVTHEIDDSRAGISAFSRSIPKISVDAA